MYKVFIENKAVLFISDESFIPFNRTLYIYKPVTFDYLDLRKRRRRLPKEVLLVVKCEDEKLAWNKFKSSLKLVIAAGGLVENKKGQYLLIYRNRRWDLPKGKLKKNEGKKEGAIREVEEETGIVGLKIEGKLIRTFHVINRNGENILKKVYWFKMTSKSKKTLKAQVEEGITRVEWTNKKKTKKRFKNSWGTIREVVQAAKILKQPK